MKIIALIILSLHFAYAQIKPSSVDTGNEYWMSISKESEFRFVEYPSDILVKVGPKSALSCPEVLLQNYLSADNESWLFELYHIDKPRPKYESYYEDVKKMNTDSVFFILKNKILLKVGDVEFACVKFLIKEEGATRKASFGMKKTSKGWQFHDSFTTSDLVMMLWSFKDNYINDFFVRKKSENKLLNGLIATTYEKGALNLITLGIELNKLKSDPRFEELLDIK